MISLKLTVTVDDAHMDVTEAVAAALAKHGFHVDDMIPEAGAIFGTAAPDVIDTLRKTVGVMDIRQTRGYQLPPMDPRIPQ